MHSEDTDTHHALGLDGGGQIRLIRLTGTRTLGPPLILAHGTLSNAGTVRSFGGYLACRGHDVWLFEWGGHGSSTPPRSRRNFEAPAFEELPRALAFVRGETGAEQIFWVGHSGGGLLPLMYLARHPECQGEFAGLVTLGAQATAAALTWRQKFKAVSLYLMTQIMGRTPRIQKTMGDEGEPTTLLAQWAVWNLKRAWTGRGGINYMDRLDQLAIPCMVIAGAADVIAPVRGCRAVFRRLGSPDKTWVACSAAEGFSRDFSHGGLARGTSAEREIFPKVAAWLRERCG